MLIGWIHQPQCNNQPLRNKRGAKTESYSNTRRRRSQAQYNNQPCNMTMRRSTRYLGLTWLCFVAAREPLSLTVHYQLGLAWLCVVSQEPLSHIVQYVPLLVYWSCVYHQVIDRSIQQQAVVYLLNLHDCQIICYTVYYYRFYFKHIRRIIYMEKMDHVSEEV